MAKSGSDDHIAAVKRRLVHLSGVAGQATDSERRILSAAEERLDVIDKELAGLRPRAIADDAAGDRYQELTLERGRLHQVIAQARQVLA